jgi:hypothetical protein
MERSSMLRLWGGVYCQFVGRPRRDLDDFDLGRLAKERRRFGKWGCSRCSHVSDGLRTGILDAPSQNLARWMLEATRVMCADVT